MDNNDISVVRQVAAEQVAHYLVVQDCPSCRKQTIMVRALPLVYKEGVKPVNKFRCLECLNAFTQENTLKPVLEK